MDKLAVAGIEVSAEVLVVAFDNGQLRSLEFPNTAAGHQQMLRLLRKNSVQVRACMESTGRSGCDVMRTVASGIVRCCSPRRGRNNL